MKSALKAQRIHNPRFRAAYCGNWLLFDKILSTGFASQPAVTGGNSFLPFFSLAVPGCKTTQEKYSLYGGFAFDFDEPPYPGPWRRISSTHRFSRAQRRTQIPLARVAFLGPFPAATL